MEYADYKKRGRLYFCGLACQDKFHIGPRVRWDLRSNSRSLCINAVVEGVVDHQTIAVRFIPYGIQPVIVRIMEYRDDEMDLEYDDIRYRFLSALLDPQTGDDGVEHYAICSVNIATVEAGLIHAVVHVPQGSDFNEYNLTATLPEDDDGQPTGTILNLSKLMTQMTADTYADHPLTNRGLDDYESKADSYVEAGHYREPLDIHVKPHAFTNELKAEGKLRKGATRIPESTINRVLRSKKTSKLERRRAQFAKNARHWHHPGRSRSSGGRSRPSGRYSKK